MAAVTLISSDGEAFVVEPSVAQLSGTIKNILDDIEDPGNRVTIPIEPVSGGILAKVVEYCKKQAAHEKALQAITDTQSKEDKSTREESMKEEERQMKAYGKEFTTTDQKTLFDLILAANFLDIKPLLDVTCEAVAMMIKGKTPEEIRATFHLKNDYTPEEEEAILLENRWAFD